MPPVFFFGRGDRMNLEDYLIEYHEQDIYPMHMPGHKRNTERMRMANPYRIDVTEAGALDNLHEPSGILAEAMERCRRIFGSQKSFFLVNGSTCGILAGICAATRKGGKILLSRACHKSVYNGMYLRELEGIYLYPERDAAFGVNGSISPEQVETALRAHPDVELVVLPSPTYEGVVSDVRTIGEICHRFGVPLLVDAAHGAHFGFSEGFPQRAILLGADLVVESLHKTLPAFTQTSVLHFNSNLVSERRLRQQLTLFQTTSPSYILMSGIDKCMEFLDSPECPEAFVQYEERLKNFGARMRTLQNIRVLCYGQDSLSSHPDFFGFDPGKIVISVGGTGMTGAELERMLREKYRIQLEMAHGDYGIAMTSVFDTEEGFVRLEQALLELDGKLAHCPDRIAAAVSVSSCPMPAAVLSCTAALEAAGTPTERKACTDRVSQEYLYAYPPGIPILVPGERLTKEVLDYIDALERTGTEIHSIAGDWPETIWTVPEKRIDEPDKKR